MRDRKGGTAARHGSAKMVLCGAGATADAMAARWRAEARAMEEAKGRRRGVGVLARWPELAGGEGTAE